MKTIQPCYEIFDLPEATSSSNLLQHLERIGRVCYKSEDRITNDSAIKFLNNIRNRKHWAMLEHYIFVMSVPKGIYYDIMDLFNFSSNNWKLHNNLKYIDATYWDDAPKEDLKYIVSGSATAFNYIWESISLDNIDNYRYSSIIKLCNFLTIAYPEIMLNPTNRDILAWPGIRFLSRKEIESLPVHLRMMHDSMSVKFTCDRGVSHELVRHRPASWAHESTRYCNYSKDKFDNGVTIINPFFFEEGTKEYEKWKCVMDNAEQAYLWLINECKRSPQEARSVLSFSTKGDIVMTARMGEWSHFFEMRAASTAHPQMREIVVPLFKEMLVKEPELFGNLKSIIGEDDNE